MAGFAEELRRIPMSQGLGATLARAADYAQAQQHGEVALEHLLLALTEDDDAAQVLAASHVDMALLKADVSLYLGGLSGGGDTGQMALASDLKRILEAAAAAASQGRRREINGAIVLAAIVGDGRSSAAHMLRAQGLTFEEAIKALQRALAGTPQPAPKAEPGKADAEDILATARARVSTRAARGLPPVGQRPEPIAELAVEVAPEPVVPPKAETVKPKVDLPPPAPPSLSNTSWPPDVRTSEAMIDKAERAVDFDTVQAEIEAARSGEEENDQRAYEQAYHDAPGYGVGDVADAGSFSVPGQAALELPMAMPPMLPPMASVPPPPLPTSQGGYYAQPPAQPPPSSRWPAPVSPAWKDQNWKDQQEAPPPLPPALPEWTDQSYQTDEYVSQPGWPAPDLHDNQPDFQQAQDHGHHGLDGRMEPAFGEHFPPPVPPSPPWPNGAGPGMHGYEPPDSRHLEPGNGGEPPVYDPAWPHQEPVAQWSEAGDGSAVFGEAGGPMLGDAGRSAGGVPVPRTRRRKSADRPSAGQLVEGIPRKMRAHVASSVDVRLTKAEFIALLDGLSDETVHGAEVGCLSVKLRAPDGRFMIEPVSPETQWADIEAGFGTSDSVSWRWTVTPFKSGRHRLQLIVSARTPGANGPAVVTALPEQIIHVRVGRNFGRGFAKLAGWIVIAVVAGLVAKYGAGVLEPVIAEVLGALK